MIQIKNLCKTYDEFYLKNINMGLIGKEKRFPNELSGGEKQRVALVRAIVTKPKLLLMDEPFFALDFNLRVKIQNLVKELHRKLDITIIFVTHDREESFFLSNRIVIMYQGKILDFATPEKLYNQPRYVYSASLLSIENIFTGGLFSQFFNLNEDKIKNKSVIRSKLLITRFIIFLFSSKSIYRI